MFFKQVDLPIVPIPNLEKTADFYRQAGMSKYLPDLYDVQIQKSPFYGTPSDHYKKYGWNYSSFVCRLRPCPMGSRKYTLPTTKRVHNASLASIVRESFAYVSSYSPAIANMDAAYKNKNRFDRDPYPEASLPPAWRVCFEHAFQATSRRFQTAVCGSRPYTIDQVIDELDLKKSCGYPWKLRFRSKKEFLTPGPDWDPMTVLENFTSSLDSESSLFYSFWMDKLKDEIRPNEKLADNKIRTFNISPIEVCIADNMYGLNFNQNFYASGASLNNWSTVGASKYAGDWNKMVLLHAAIGLKNTFSADGGQWDSRLFVFIMWLCCRLRCMWTLLDEKQRRRVRNLYRVSIHRFVYGENGDLLMFYLGNASGRTSTIVDNTICHANVWNMAWFLVVLLLDKEKNIDPSQSYQDKNMWLSLCGDDVLATFSDEVLPWFNASRLAPLFQRFGILMEFESFEPRHFSECVYLSNTSVLCDGIWIPTPNRDRVLAGLIESAEEDSNVEFESVDPRWTLLRLYAIRIETWGNAELREILRTTITRVCEKYRDLFNNTSADFVIKAGVTWSQVSSVWKDDAQIKSLYTGLEGGALNLEFPFIFESCKQNVLSQAFRMCCVFDPTMGYPGEGPVPRSEAEFVAFGGDYVIRRSRRNVFYRLPNDPVVRAVRQRERLRGLFDPTKGYPGEGPLSDLAFKYHGNWGGPNFGGGKHLEKHEQPDWDVPPVDELDASFRRHDYNYTRMSEGDADKIWLEEARLLPVKSRSLLKAQLARLGFHGKKHLENWKSSLFPKWREERVVDPGGYPWDSVDDFSWIVDEKTPPLEDPSEGVFDKTKGYEGEGPPKGSMKKKKSSRKRTTFAKKVRSKKGKMKQKMKRSTVQAPITVYAKKVPIVKTGSSLGQLPPGKVYAFTLTDMRYQYANVWSDGNGQTSFSINPYSIAGMSNTADLGSPVVSACDFKKRWTGRIRISYVAQCPTNTAGAVGVFADLDPADTDESISFGSDQIVSTAAEHASKKNLSTTFPVYDSKSWVFSTNKALWLRRAKDTDVRTSSLGRFYMYCSAPNPTVQSFGQVFIEYELSLNVNSSNERVYCFNALSHVPMTLATTNYYVSFPENGWSRPRAEVVQPATVAVVNNGALSNTIRSTDGINLVVGEEAPITTYVEMVMYAESETPAAISTMSIYMFLNGVDVTEDLSIENAPGVYSAASYTAIKSYVLKIPAGTQPNTLQLVPMVRNGATATNLVAVYVWITPSFRFVDDGWTMNVSPLQLMRKNRDDEKVDFSRWDSRVSALNANLVTSFLQDSEPESKSDDDRVFVEQSSPKEGVEVTPARKIVEKAPKAVIRVPFLGKY